MIQPIVHAATPVTLLGGADIDAHDLNMCLSFAPTVVAADGGADHALRAGLRPAAVIGDMDSLTPAARAAFGTIMHPVAEQDTTDFEKCLTRITAPLIMAAGFLGGRLDHTLSTLGVLARLRAWHVVLVSRWDVCVLLPQGDSVWPVAEGLPLGLLPLGQARVSSQGLRWDLDDRAMAPDGLVSSSNAVAASPVRLQVAGPVLLTLSPQAARVVTDVVRGR
ncbi:thiamine diphosphokinase [Loktanella sp. M215]|uniref:thiamine diphosphokinase n=1 Tax=Loktanella sp. M215 TaxID=2675431 RepID=UPI001F004FE8|nr:thiamine diphosphokinase [Loktanella sp. M215]